MIENVGFHPTFSRHGKVQASLTLLVWLNENVGLSEPYADMLASVVFWRELAAYALIFAYVVAAHRGTAFGYDFFK